MSYALAFVGFAVLIILHEAGHFAAAKAVGMRVERFSLFFGPMFVKRRIGETDYGIGTLPFGGYVKITGMSPEESFETPEIAARAYVNQPPWKRIVVIAAGPVVNLLIAFLLLWVAYMGSSHYVTTRRGAEIATSTVGFIKHGSAAQGVLRLGDRILSIDGIRATPALIHEQVMKHRCAGGVRVDRCLSATPVRLVVQRGHALKRLSVHPRWASAYKAMLLGIGFDAKTAPNGVIFAAGRSVGGLWRVTTRTVAVIANLFKSKDRRKLHSIIGGYAIASQQIAAGWITGVEVIALISLSLAIINLFPFLPLDGGHIFWAVVEKIRGRRITLRVMERASIVGIALIGLLMVIGLSNDISSLAGSGFGPQ